ncbi:MAG: S10 family peptidase [Thermomicrobiales bacterium]
MSFLRAALPLLAVAAPLLGSTSAADGASGGEIGTDSEAEKPSTPSLADMDRPPVTTQHQLSVGGKTLHYSATTGFMPVANEKGEIEARLFFTAYTLNGPDGDRDRPLMFSFNGGPGSSSVWLHLGGLGPSRVEMLHDGAMPAPPFKLVENEQTWLEETDLVFVDPVDTGYSRAASDELAKKFTGVDEDLKSVGAFIRLYLTRYQRWGSPLFLVGESYGTFRAAGLAGLLIDQGIAFNGIVLVSSILNMQTARFDRENDLPYVLFLPTYAATAWYHGKLEKNLQQRDLADVLNDVETWALGDYSLALAKGRSLTGSERETTANQLARYTGLTRGYIEQSNLRIQIQRFCKELRREDGRTVGRLDSRYMGFDAFGTTERPDFDPSMSAIRPPFTTMLNDYVRRDLGFETDIEYHILRSLDWDWGSAGEGYPRTSEALSDAFARNPYLKLFVACGYYDLATPYFATRYTLNHLAIESSVADQIRIEHYPVGHMVYLERQTLATLQVDVASFIHDSLAVEDRPLGPSL